MSGCCIFKRGTWFLHLHGGVWLFELQQISDFLLHVYYLGP